MNSEPDHEECIPIKSDVCRNLSTEEVYDLLVHASGKYKNRISTAPPVKPKGGTVFLYNLGENAETWDLKKRQIRCACTISW